MTNYKHTAVVLLFLFFKSGLFSQITLIRGIVRSEDFTPVQYATIYDSSQKSGTFSDSLGRFSINISGKASELHISAIGYKDKITTVGINDNLSDFHIVLLNDTLYLKEAVISSKIFNPKQIKLGPRKKIKGYADICSLFFNHEIGLYVPNHEQIHGEIKSIEIYLNKESDETRHLIRLRVYSVDEKLSPAKDLLLDNILLQVEKTKKNQLIDIDLEKYNISIPSNGMVIALESVQNTQKPYLHSLNAQNIGANKRSSISTVLVDDNTNKFIQWNRIDKGKWYNVDFTSPAKQHRLNITNLVPYVKLTINEYAGRE